MLYLFQILHKNMELQRTSGNNRNVSKYWSNAFWFYYKEITLLSHTLFLLSAINSPYCMDNWITILQYNLWVEGKQFYYGIKQKHSYQKNL